ncbi:MAG: arsenite methyltransferase [Polyangiaceae bacterium]
MSQDRAPMTQDDIRAAVRRDYARVANADPSAGCMPGCCGPTPHSSLALGYSADDLASVPEGANLGLGCGNPQVLAALVEGERVLDLGSGGGFDAFLAARKVGDRGSVVGVDMTPEMVAKARRNAAELGLEQVDFRLGEIERLPVADASVDVIMSNCVINLSPDKAAVYREAFRVLAPGGRLAISDVVMTAPLPDTLATQIEALTGCIAGAITVDTMRDLLAEAGFSEVEVKVDDASRAFIAEWMPGSGAERFIASASVVARKSGAGKGVSAKETAAEPGACCAPSCCG